ncbi:MAG: hypothetical protein KIS66_04320 [Fimbriimonadaceae bacterium]|nr:hypothetical protein [Fimbriimonadaceae bacterium]
MKRFLATLLLVLPLLGAFGCGEPPPQRIEITEKDREAAKHIRGGGRPAPMPVDGIDN